MRVCCCIAVSRGTQLVFIVKVVSPVSVMLSYVTKRGVCVRACSMSCQFRMQPPAPLSVTMETALFSFFLPIYGVSLLSASPFLSLILPPTYLSDSFP